jgi:hypothetical protein
VLTYHLFRIRQRDANLQRGLQRDSTGAVRRCG